MDTIGSGLTLVTGATGSGKTLWLVSILAELKDRPLYVHGIPELRIDHDSTPGLDEWTERRFVDGSDLPLPYFRFPPLSVVVVDEAQRIFRPRAVGSTVPDYVAAFETRRHTGVDFVLLTQHPNLLDSNIRRLVNRHVHIHCTALGRYKLEWVGLGDPESSSSRALAVRSRYKLNENAFRLYKSAEVHTKPVVKRSSWLFILPALVVGLAVLSWQIYSRVSGAADATKAQVATLPATSSSTAKTATGPMNLTDYLAAYTPRVPALAYSAPRYDAITQPVEAPYSAGCIASKNICQCYDQRGGRYEVDQLTCRQWINRPQFIDFISSQQTTAQPVAGGRTSDGAQIRPTSQKSLASSS